MIWAISFCMVYDMPSNYFVRVNFIKAYRRDRISLSSSSKDTYGAKGGLVNHHPQPHPHHQPHHTHPHHPHHPPHHDQVTPMVGRRGVSGCSRGGRALRTCFTEAAISTRRSFNPRR